jgi:hypothetical protein
LSLISPQVTGLAASQHDCKFRLRSRQGCAMFRRRGGMGCRETKIVLASLTSLSIWLFVVLPIYHGNLMLETVKDVATIAAAAVGAVSVVVALLAFRTNRENQKETVLQKAYFDYAKMAVDMPELAFPFKSNIDLEKQTLDGDTLKFERYEWFLSSMLVMCHFVTKMRREDEFWKALVITQISYHWQYIEHFWTEKEFIKNWRNADLRTRMIEGIKKGKETFRPVKPNRSWDEIV